MGTRRLREATRSPGLVAPSLGRPWQWLLLLLAPLLLLAWVLSASRAGDTIEGCLGACSGDADPRHAGLRVVSLNMLHGFPRFQHLDERLDIIEGELRRLDPDIVCLQEVPWRPGLGTAAGHLAGRLGMNHVYARANGNRWAILFEEGEAILSRYPLRDATLVELAPRARFFEHRVALSATAQTAVGDVVIVVTHLTHGDPRVNLAQTRELAGVVARLDEIVPAIIAGDFNAREASDQIVELGWVDTYRVAHPNGRGWTCCVDDLGAGPGEPLEKRIDYLFLVPSSEGAGAVVDSQLAFAEPQRVGDGWLWPSDHVGLLSIVSLQRAAEP